MDKQPEYEYCRLNLDLCDADNDTLSKILEELKNAGWRKCGFVDLYHNVLIFYRPKQTE